MTAVEIGSQRHKAFGSRPRRWLPGRELADLSLTVTATPELLGQIRAWLRSLANLLGATEEEGEDVALAVHEACANVIAHAYPHSFGPVVLRVRARRSLHSVQLRVLVSDRGQGLGGRSARAGLGAGLRLMEALTRRMRVRSDPNGATEVELSFKLSGRNPTAAG